MNDIRIAVTKTKRKYANSTGLAVDLRSGLYGSAFKKTQDKNTVDGDVFVSKRYFNRILSDANFHR